MNWCLPPRLDHSPCSDFEAKVFMCFIQCCPNYPSQNIIIHQILAFVCVCVGFAKKPTKTENHTKCSKQTFYFLDSKFKHLLQLGLLLQDNYELEL